MSSSGPSKQPPPLPFRPSQTSMDTADAETDITPPSYESVIQDTLYLDHDWARRDPRSSSQQSLVPADDAATDVASRAGRRRLLLIYIHGFMGNETSFRSFPAHMHNLLTVVLAPSHVVHTKIYPRYQSRRHLRVARDDFSAWLRPHEDAETDVVLLGHSMGGLLAAEVVLLPATSEERRREGRALEHRILGVINFDVPFLGLHPGIVKSGLASIFKPAEETHEDQWTPEPGDTFWSSNDPNYNPKYTNDINLPIRKGWSNAWHFINKHSDNLTQATKSLVQSHMEFGGAMANMSELKARYVGVRSLEEENEQVRKSVVKGNHVPRVRFINYYTASHGRPKAKTRTSDDNAKDVPTPSESGTQLDSGDHAAGASSGTQTDSALGGSGPSTPDLEHIDPIAESDGSQSKPKEPTDPQSDHIEGLPPLPELPQAPPPLDVSFIQDKDTRKLVEKEHSRAAKAYEKAVKEREKAIQDRAKLVEKRKRKEQKAAEDAARKEQKAAEDAARKAQKAAEEAERQAAKAKKAAKPESEMTHSEREELRLEKERQRMEAEARRMRGEPEVLPTSPSPTSEATTIAQDASEALESAASAERPSASTQTSQQSLDSSSAQRPSLEPKDSEKKKSKGPPKDRKFCNLPPKDSQGQRDPCWVRVFMEGVDEVGAHCGLFFVDPRYERMVGEVAGTIEGWLQEESGVIVRPEKR